LVIAIVMALAAFFFWPDSPGLSQAKTPSGLDAKSTSAPTVPAAAPHGANDGAATDATAGRVSALEAVHLHCMDDTGRPVAGCKAFLVPGIPRCMVARECGWTARANESGVVDCSPLLTMGSSMPRDAHILAIAPRHAPSTIALATLLSSREVDLKLDSAVVASVTLKDLSENPIPDTAVIAYRGTRPSIREADLPGAGPDDIHVAVSDKNGVATFESCRADVYDLLVGVPDGVLAIVGKDSPLDLRSGPTSLDLTVAPLLGAAVLFAPEAPQRLILPPGSAFSLAESAEGSGLLAKTRLATRFPKATPVIVLAKRFAVLRADEVITQRFQAQWSRPEDQSIDVDLKLQPIASISEAQEVRIAAPQHPDDGELKVMVVAGDGLELSGITFYAQKVGTLELRSILSSSSVKLAPGKYAIRTIGGPTFLAKESRTAVVESGETASVVIKLDQAIRKVEFKVQYEDGSAPQAVTLGIESAIGSSNLNSIRPSCIPEVVGVGPCRVVVVAAGLKSVERQVVVEPGPWKEPQQVTLTIPK
jgi:hypothetical protein